MWDLLALNAMSVKQLRVIGHGYDIPGVENMSKAMLVYSIIDAQNEMSPSQNEQPESSKPTGVNITTCSWSQFAQVLDVEESREKILSLFARRTASLLFSFLRKCGTPNFDEFEEELIDGATHLVIPSQYRNPIRCKLQKDQTKEQCGELFILDMLLHDEEFSHEYTRHWQEPWGSFKWCCNWLGGMCSFPEPRYKEIGGGYQLNYGMDGWGVDSGREDLVRGIKCTRYVAFEWNNLVGGSPEIHGTCLPECSNLSHLWEWAIRSVKDNLIDQDDDDWAVPMIMLDLQGLEVYILNHHGTMLKMSEFNKKTGRPFFDWHTTLARLFHGE